MCLQHKSFENTVKTGEIAHYQQFLLFRQCFLPIWITFCHFHYIYNSRLQILSVWKRLKFAVWEGVKRMDIIERLQSGFGKVYLRSIFTNHSQELYWPFFQDMQIGLKHNFWLAKPYDLANQNLCWIQLLLKIESKCWKLWYGICQGNQGVLWKYTQTNKSEWTRQWTNKLRNKMIWGWTASGGKKLVYHSANRMI